MTASDKKKIIGLGELLWDIFPSGRKFGGAPANFAFHAQNLGGDSSIISSVGDDDLGKDIMNHLGALDLKTRYLQIDKHHPTGSVEIKLDDEGKPDYIIHEDVAWDNIQFIADLEQLAKQADAICFGSLAQRSAISAKTIQKFISLVPNNGLKVFDINLRQAFYDKDTITASLEKCNCLKLNDDELPVVASYFGLGGDEVSQFRDLITMFDLTLVALTKGAEGSLLVSETDSSSLGTSEVNIADTVGAGDAFTAALVMGLLNGLSLQHTHLNANNLAAYVCTQNGATPGLPAKLLEELTKY